MSMPRVGLQILEVLLFSSHSSYSVVDVFIEELGTGGMKQHIHPCFALRTYIDLKFRFAVPFSEKIRLDKDFYFNKTQNIFMKLHSYRFLGLCFIDIDREVASKGSLGNSAMRYIFSL